MKEIVRLENVSKSFIPKKYIVKDLTLSVYEGEFLTLLGSSGCGKTTILRMISGLENVTSGKVFIDNVDVTNLEPAKREVNTIFQNLALFPHMTVFQNIEFGLKMKKIPLDERIKKINKAIKLVELDGLENRYPRELSGGQQQRVAIARGIVMNPKVLLLDESLCSLDLKLKRSMQIELKRIQKKLGITFIYVTHDQDEALTMSDRIIIFDKGIIQQDDTPENIYCFPKSTYVADFIGESNIFNGIVEKIQAKTLVKIDERLKFYIDNNSDDKIKDKINIMIRPENIKVSVNELKDSIDGVIKEIIYDGAITKLFISILDDLIIKVNVHGIVNYKEDDKVYIKFNEDSVVPIRRHYEKK